MHIDTSELWTHCFVVIIFRMIDLPFVSAYNLSSRLNSFFVFSNFLPPFFIKFTSKFVFMILIAFRYGCARPDDPVRLHARVRLKPTWSYINIGSLFGTYSIATVQTGTAIRSCLIFTQNSVQLALTWRKPSGSGTPCTMTPSTSF